MQGQNAPWFQVRVDEWEKEERERVGEEAEPREIRPRKRSESWKLFHG